MIDRHHLNTITNKRNYQLPLKQDYGSPKPEVNEINSITDVLRKNRGWHPQVHHKHHIENHTTEISSQILVCKNYVFLRLTNT